MQDVIILSSAISQWLFNPVDLVTLCSRTNKINCNFQPRNLVVVVVAVYGDTSLRLFE